MPNVQVFASMNPNRTLVRPKQAMPDRAESTDSPLMNGPEFLLAAIGAETSDALLSLCRTEGWNVDNLYIELGLHGAAPGQAIGQRIWVDGQLAGDQVASLLRVAEHLPLLRSLHPSICLRSRVEKLRRPDLE